MSCSISKRGGRGEKKMENTKSWNEEGEGDGGGGGVSCVGGDPG